MARTRNAGLVGGLTEEGPPLLPEMRRLLLVAAVLVFLAGLQLFVFPTRTDEYFAWTIASPMTAVFLGAAYWSAVVLEVSGARARSWCQARIAVPTVFVFTSLTLAATLLHLERFHFVGDSATTTRLVTWAWLAIYIVVPILMIVITLRQRQLRVADPRRTQRLPRGIRLAVVALAFVLGAAGLLLFFAPDVSASWWPWPLTPLTSRAVGAWLISLGVAAGHAAIEDDVARIRPLGATAISFGLLEAVALLRYGRELDWSSAVAYGFVAVLAMLLALGLWALRASRSGEDPRVDQHTAD